MSARTIHALLARLTISDADYRVMLWDRFHASSSKDLTAAQAQELVATLHSLLPADQRQQHPRPQAAAGARVRFANFDGREGMATGKQMRMLEASFVQRSRAETLAAKQAAFVEFVRNRFRIQRLEWIAQKHVGQILRAIQSINPNDIPRAATRRARQPLRTTIKGS